MALVVFGQVERDFLTAEIRRSDAGRFYRSLCASYPETKYPEFSERFQLLLDGLDAFRAKQIRDAPLGFDFYPNEDRFLPGPADHANPRTSDEYISVAQQKERARSGPQAG